MSNNSTVFHLAAGKDVTRDVTIVAPYQAGHAVTIKTGPLPSNKPGPRITHSKAGPNPGQEKGNNFLIWVINPRVYDSVTGKLITRFAPALTITVVYLPEDERKGEGKLSLCVCYQRRDKTWRYEILLTRMDIKKKTLTAKIDNLRPTDPVGMGEP